MTFLIKSETHNHSAIRWLAWFHPSDISNNKINMLGLSSIWFSYFFDRRSFILFYGIGRELDLVRKGRKACHDNFMSIIGYMSTCSSSTNYLFSFFFNNYLHNMVVFQIQYPSLSYLRATRNKRNAYFLSISLSKKRKV